MQDDGQGAVTAAKGAKVLIDRQWSAPLTQVSLSGAAQIPAWTV
ncbi:MAG: hypothetical protein VW268_07340 [Rhodospirillaceae bacterium]